MARRFLGSVAILAGIVMLGTPPPADAAFRMRLNDGLGNGVVLTDTTNSGVIFFNGAIGNFLVNVTTGTSQPPLPLNPNAFSSIDLNSVNVVGTSGGTMTITLEYDGFTNGAPGPLLVGSDVGGTLAGSTGTSVLFQSWANGANAVPNLGPDQTTVGSVGTSVTIPGGSTPVFGPPGITFGPGAYSGTGTAAFVAGSQYSLFSQAVLTFGAAGGSVSFNHSTYTTPEPATLVAALVGLPALGGAWWRRRRAEALAV